jgi:hypothetical protein
MNSLLKRVAVPVGAAFILGSSGFALMAQNVQDPSSAGYSSASVNGYDVNSIHYGACAPMNGNYCNVSFLLKPLNGEAPANTGTNVQASVNNSGVWKTCIYEGAPGSNQGTKWTCSITPTSTGDLESLQISAAQ